MDNKYENFTKDQLICLLEDNEIFFKRSRSKEELVEKLNKSKILIEVKVEKLILTELLATRRIQLHTSQEMKRDIGNYNRYIYNFNFRNENCPTINIFNIKYQVI